MRNHTFGPVIGAAVFNHSPKLSPLKATNNPHLSRAAFRQLTARSSKCTAPTSRSPTRFIHRLQDPPPHLSSSKTSTPQPHSGNHCLKPRSHIHVKGGEKTCHWGGVKLYHLGGAFSLLTLTA